jgi:hypothetical protein
MTVATIRSRNMYERKNYIYAVAIKLVGIKWSTLNVLTLYYNYEH